MKHTKHCQQRMNQRGKSARDIRIIQKYGETRRGGIGMLSRRRTKAVVLRMKAWMKKHASPVFRRRAAQVREIVRLLEKMTDWMIVADGGVVITVYRADRRRQRKFMRGDCRPCEQFSRKGG